MTNNLINPLLTEELLAITKEYFELLEEYKKARGRKMLEELSSIAIRLGERERYLMKQFREL